MYQAWFDGSMKNGECTIGYLIVSPNQRIVREVGYKVGDQVMSNIQDVEAYALKILLECLQRLHLDNVMVYGDNRAVVSMIKGKKCKIAWQEYINNKVIEFSNIKINWIPRKKNKHTDKITKMAYAAKVKKHGGKLAV